MSGIPRGYQFPKEDGNWLQEKYRDQILSVSPDIELIELPESFIHNLERVEDVEVLLCEGGNKTHYPGELDFTDYLKFFTPNLKWVHLCSTGFSDNITPEIIDGRVVLTNSPGIHTVPIAESILAAMLDKAKMLKQRRIDQSQKIWKQLKCSDLEGSTALLIGLGNIGRRVAMLCKAFGTHVIGTRRTMAAVPNVDLIFPPTELSKHLPEADFIMVMAPLTHETRGLLGRYDFQKMKKTSYFINVGRGEVADEHALLTALEENWIAGAYLDCFAVEPLPIGHPIWEMENVFLIPHDSHSSPKIGDRIIDQFTDNLRNYVQSKPLNNICDPRRGY